MKKSILFFIVLFIVSCEKAPEPDSLVDPIEEEGEVPEYATGWLSDEENTDKIPGDVDIGFGTSNLPTRINLTSKFPPIGNQNPYGTCVAWAVGYNLKTSMDAIDNGYSSTQLNNSSFQFSPKDLFLAIPSSLKRANCNGTNFEYAFDVLMQRGIATMATVPYSELSDCSRSPQNSWNNNAANNKIKNYRKIDVSIENIKGYLHQDQPVVIGADIGRNFMNWNSADILSSDPVPHTGQHGKHALIISGYDDEKGPRGAFKIINSWGKNWGDNGYIWVDYNFMVTDFIFGGNAFIANNISKNINPDNEDNEPLPPSSGLPDLIPWNLYDEVDWDTERVLSYDVFNIGEKTVKASKDWSVVYIYYNAYDADDLGIILYDYYSDDYGSYGENGPLDDGYGYSGNWWNHIDLNSEESIANEVFNDEEIRWPYNMPYITGYYYLVMLADPFELVEESNESNNMYFLSDSNGYPIYFDEGEAGNGSGKTGKHILKNKHKDANPTKLSKPQSGNITNQKPNAYTPREIKKLINHHQSSGKLQKMITKHLQKKKTS